MTSGTSVSLAELMTIKHGFAFKGDDITTDAQPYFLVTPGNFTIGGGFKLGRVKYFKGDVPEEYILRPGDLVVTMTDLSKEMDTLGYAATVPVFPSGLTALHNQRIGLIKITCPDVDQRWLEYRMRAADYRAEILASSSGSTVHHTSPSRILNIRLKLPPIEEQRAIAATLSALDDKIESNRRLVGLVPRLIRSRVEEHLVEEANDVSVSTLAKFVNGGAYTKGATGSGRMVIRIAELNSGPGGSTVYNELDAPEDKTAHAGDVLMSWSGSLGVYRWARDEAIINQHIFKVIPTGYPAWLVYDRIDAVIDVFRGYAADKATTMGHIKRGDLDTTTVQLPREKNLRELDAALGPLWNRLLIAEQELLRLEELRDAILPELLSGRMRVPEAREVEA